MEQGNRHMSSMSLNCNHYAINVSTFYFANADIHKVYIKTRQSYQLNIDLVKCYEMHLVKLHPQNISLPRDITLHDQCSHALRALLQSHHDPEEIKVNCLKAA